jgi:hypothetical protein
MRTFTISEIADRIRRPDEEIGAVIDRLKNWVKEGLLKPVGERHPGTGRHRRFPESALIDAAILHVMTDQIGMQAVQAGALRKLFIDTRKAFSRKPDAERFVTIGRSPDNRAAEIGLSHAEGLAGLLAGSPHESHVVINLQKLFKRLEG